MALNNKNIKQSNGFTLIEVMVAMLIVSLGIVSVIDVTAKHVSNMSELEKRMVASWVASNHVSEIRHEAKVDKIRTGSDVERVKMGGQKWRSKARIEKTEVEKVFLLTINVTDDADPKKKVYASVTTAVTDRL
jgi:general secretion pathway protein I